MSDPHQHTWTPAEGVGCYACSCGAKGKRRIAGKQRGQIVEEKRNEPTVHTLPGGSSQHPPAEDDRRARSFEDAVERGTGGWSNRCVPS